MDWRRIGGRTTDAYLNVLLNGGQATEWDFFLKFIGSSFIYIYVLVAFNHIMLYSISQEICFVVVIHWLIFPYPSGLLNWHCGNLTIAPVPAKQPWWIWINTSCEFIMNDCITTTKQSTTNRVHFSWDILYWTAFLPDSLYWTSHIHNKRLILYCKLLINPCIYSTHFYWNPFICTNQNYNMIPQHNSHLDRSLHSYYLNAF